ncbi:MAG: RNA 2',3'-cyclic phosphodiesterase [Patescibacteria group bacterium]|nr:RNA 2',3'-cyclic phosphodiesterase [Patescibacteria group bacterium]
MRAFLAIYPSTNVLNSLIELQSSVKRFKKYLRFTRSENIHLTIRFLGDIVNEGSIGLIGKGLKEIISQTPSFDLRIKESKFGFPGQRWPSILYTRVAKSEGLDRLNQVFGKVQGNLGDVEQVLHESDPIYHFTIARVNSRLNNQVVTDIRNKIAGIELWREFHVNKIFLLESIFRESGPEYRIVSSLHLGLDKKA